MRGGVTPGRLEGSGTPFNWPAAIGYGRQPFANIVSGAGQLTAGPNGVQLGIFGWADPDTGEVTNTPTGQQGITTDAGAQITTQGGESIVTFGDTAVGLLGFVLPITRMWDWNRCTPTPPGALVRGFILRAGLPCVLAAAGDFLTVFPFGAQAGQQVFADPATGYAYSGNPGGLVGTPWVAMETACRCNAVVRISSFVEPIN